MILAFTRELKTCDLAGETPRALYVLLTIQEYLQGFLNWLFIHYC
ncbi:hypothetical protein HMPREF0044_0447 [Gleimia coleocanis DSM 15436]|uniref:Uncharacterized protein n=1 Tax=Gleimia coleocanis DSM 15436 TaxID=525245 RepID=C0VZ57_9ACTO|nr:hypothetical protein HMPREF0044_0447 [Gleimia coleocanis DSM 15436]